MIRKMLMMVAVLLLPLVIQSDELRSVDIVTTLDVELLGTTYPHVAWQGSGPMRYQWKNGAGEVIGGDVPRMTQYCPVAIPGYTPLLLAVSGRPGSRASISFHDDDIVVSGLDLELAVEKAPSVAGVVVPAVTGRKLLVLHFNDIRLTSGQLAVAGRALQGKIDVDAMSVEFVFAKSIPLSGNKELDAAIAGKTVLGRFKIALKNPYHK